MRCDRRIIYMFTTALLPTVSVCASILVSATARSRLSQRPAPCVGESGAGAKAMLCDADRERFNAARLLASLAIRIRLSVCSLHAPVEAV